MSGSRGENGKVLTGSMVGQECRLCCGDGSLVAVPLHTPWVGWTMLCWQLTQCLPTGALLSPWHWGTAWPQLHPVLSIQQAQQPAVGWEGCQQAGVYTGTRELLLL